MFKITQTVHNEVIEAKYTLECYVKEDNSNKLLYTLYNIPKHTLARYLEGENVDAIAVLENTGRPIIITN